MVIDEFIIKSKNGVETVITNPVQLVAGKELTDMIQNSPMRDGNNRIIIPVKVLNSMDEIFEFNLENNELSTTLEATKSLIENSDHNGIDEIDPLVNNFISLLNEGDITLAAVHAEMIVRKLVRDINDLSIRPKRFDNKDNYVILKVSDAIQNSNSPAINLSFEKIKGSLQNPRFYMKDGTSVFDSLFY